MRYEEFLKQPPFSVPQERKKELLLSSLRIAHKHHMAHNLLYARFCAKEEWQGCRLDDLPFLPVSLFKRLDLATTPSERIVRRLTSSGTISQIPSRIPLDTTTRARQTRTLAWLLGYALGPNRLPFYLLQEPVESSPKNTEITAQEAALRGFLIAASSVTSLDSAAALADISSQPCVILGYTYQAYQAAETLRKMRVNIALPQATLLHFGGWKRLQETAVDRQAFKERIETTMGVGRVIDAYGFTEQLGVLYLDEGDGVKRCPLVSEVLVRDPQTLQPLPDGETGLLQFLTPLPHSYPGISLLTDDMGRILSREPNSQGHHGTTFEVLGRAASSERRGCGDIGVKLWR